MEIHTGGEEGELTSEVLFSSHGEEYHRRLAQLKLRAEKVIPAEGDPHTVSTFLRLV
jgi:hypothetical protein